MSLDAVLTQLEQTHLVHPAGETEAVALGNAYEFEHRLTQDAAYQSLLRTRRRALHRRVAESFESLYPDRLDENAAALAHHYVEAGDVDKAVSYHRRAALRAVSLYAYEEADHHLQIALNLLPPSVPPMIRRELLEETADIRAQLRDGSQAITFYQETLALCAQDEDAGPLVAARLHRKIIQLLADLFGAMKLEEQEVVMRSAQNSRTALEAWLAEIGSPGDADSPSTQAEAVRSHRALAYDAWRNRNLPDWNAARAHAEASLDLAQALGDAIQISKALGVVASTYLGLNELRSYLEIARRRLALCSTPDFGDLREVSDSLRDLGSAHAHVGEYALALPYLARAERLAATISDIAEQVAVLTLQSFCCLRLDRWDEALSLEALWRDLERRYARARLGPT